MFHVEIVVDSAEFLRRVVLTEVKKEKESRSRCYRRKPGVRDYAQLLRYHAERL